MTTFEIKTTVSTQDVLNMFEKAGRGNNFSYEGLEEILNMLESTQCEDVPLDLDIIAICCDFTECTPEQALSDYRLDEEDYQDEDGNLDGSLVADHFTSNSWGAYLNNGNIVYMNY